MNRNHFPEHGALLISLDFELYWGVRDRATLNEYGQNILGVRKAIPAMLDLFRDYGIRATWATVGFLFFSERNDLIAACPQKRPHYKNALLSPYSVFGNVGDNEVEDPFHFGKSLIHLIQSYPGQEIGSHTFSHFYCQEPGQDEDAFREDLLCAVQAARTQGITLRSLVFPRNQANPRYFKACADQGIMCYRGNETAWFYAKGSRQSESKLVRAARLADAYMNLTGYNIYPLKAAEDGGPTNLPASRFLRPFNTKLRLLEPLRESRITRALTQAATHGKVFHLWWHPHNFGVNLEANMAFLVRLLNHFRGCASEDPAPDYGATAAAAQRTSCSNWSERPTGGTIITLWSLLCLVASLSLSCGPRASLCIRSARSADRFRFLPWCA